jgi:hypothetical protein
MDNYITSPALFDDQKKQKISACGTVRHDRCVMPKDFEPKSLKIKRGTAT